MLAYFRVQKAAPTSSPPPEKAVPPPDTEATLATQAAAQQMWEGHANAEKAAESDNTASTTPPPESPTQPAAATAEQQQPQPTTLHAMLQGLGNLNAPLTDQQVQHFLHQLLLLAITLPSCLKHGQGKCTSTLRKYSMLKIFTSESVQRKPRYDRLDKNLAIKH